MPRPWHAKVMERTKMRHGRLLPMADLAPVVSLLLLFAVTLFVCSGLIYQPGIRISLPKLSDPDSIRGASLAISLNPEGEAYVQGDDWEALDKEDLVKRLQNFKKSCPQGTVIVRADKEARHGRVMEILSAIREAEIDRAAYGSLPEAPAIKKE